MLLGLHKNLTFNSRKKELWTPSEVSNLAVWLDASVASTLRSGTTVGSSASTGGGAVRMWVNRANTNNHIWGWGTNSSNWWDATRETSQVNGLDVVRLASRGNFAVYGPGSASARVRPLSASISGLTIIVVKKTPATLVTSAEGVTVIYNNGGFAGLHLRDLGSGYNAYWHLGYLPTSGTLSAAPKTTSTISASTTYLMVGRYEGGVSTALYLNGTLQESQSNPAASLSLATSNDQLQFGTEWGDANGSVGDNCEILLCDSALSTSDRQKAEGYLAHKWGLTASLPNDHPYKFKPPYK